MANITEMAFRPNDWFEVGSVANATATATRPAPGTQRRHLVRSVYITLSGAPTTAATVTLTGAQPAAAGGPSGTIVHNIAVGSAPSLALHVNLLCDINAAVSVVVGALGSGITANVSIVGTTTSA